MFATLSILSWGADKAAKSLHSNSAKRDVSWKKICRNEKTSRYGSANEPIDKNKFLMEKELLLRE